MSEMSVKERRSFPATERALRQARSLQWILWPTWLVALTLWTAALLTSYPAELSHENLPREVGFSLAKTLHVWTYAALAAVGFLLPLGVGWRWLPIAVLSCHGFGTEYLQQFVPLRYGCWQDVLIDHVGILTGLTLAWWLKRFIRTRWQSARS